MHVKKKKKIKKTNNPTATKEGFSCFFSQMRLSSVSGAGRRYCCASSHPWPPAPSPPQEGSHLGESKGRFLGHRLRIASAINVVLIYLLGPVLCLSEKQQQQQKQQHRPIFTLLANTYVTDSLPPCSNSNFMKQCVYI